MTSIFSKIVAGEIPCHKVAETENCLAFLDINPVRLGHTLCIPKKEVDYIYDMEDDALAELMLSLRDMDFTRPKLNPGHPKLAKIAAELRSVEL